MSQSSVAKGLSSFHQQNVSVQTRWHHSTLFGVTAAINIKQKKIPDVLKVCLKSRMHQMGDRTIFIKAQFLDWIPNDFRSIVVMCV